MLFERSSPGTCPKSAPALTGQLLNKVTYGRVGNRGTATDTYTYPTTSNRLSGINLAAGGTRAYGYDASGNVITDSRGAGYSYTYDAAGRMASMSINGVLQGTYKYDFAGRQAIRTIASTGVKGPFGV